MLIRPTAGLMHSTVTRAHTHTNRNYQFQALGVFSKMTQVHHGKVSYVTYTFGGKCWVSAMPKQTRKSIGEVNINYVC